MLTQTISLVTQPMLPDDSFPSCTLGELRSLLALAASWDDATRVTFAVGDINADGSHGVTVAAHSADPVLPPAPKPVARRAKPKSLPTTD